MSDWDIVAGDSFTELGYLPYEELFTTLLGKFLNAAVLNLGVSYTGPLTQLTPYIRRFEAASPWGADANRVAQYEIRVHFASCERYRSRRNPMIHTWSQAAADDNMSEDILVYLEPLIRQHPWWRARATLLLSLLDRSGVAPGSSVLDAGCGWGVTLDALERRGYCADGLDISRRSLERLDRPGRELIEADLVKPLPQDAKTYDAVVALDVINILMMTVAQ